MEGQRGGEAFCVGSGGVKGRPHAEYLNSFFRKAHMSCNPGSGGGWAGSQGAGPAKPSLHANRPLSPLIRRLEGGWETGGTARTAMGPLLHISTELSKYILQLSMLGSEVYKRFSQVLACWALSTLSFIGSPISQKRKSEAGSSDWACPGPHSKLETEAKIESRAGNPN